MKYYLYNSKSNNGIRPEISDSIELIDAVGMDYPAFLKGLNEEDEVVLIGGDGTLNRFINDFDLSCFGKGAGEEVKVNEYIKNLPTVRVNGLEQLFINNMGFGIDGYCCEVADKIKEKTPNKKINYTAIAIKGLLFFFKPCHATVEVDGKTFEYDSVWIAPTMKGRFYGGGMMMAPAPKVYRVFGYVKDGFAVNLCGARAGIRFSWARKIGTETIRCRLRYPFFLGFFI